jgi:hypothetical protein
MSNVKGTSLNGDRNRARSRLWLVVGLVAVIAFGLASRKFPSLFPALLGKYPGDSLWALMIFLGWAFCKPRASTRKIAALAFATSCFVEFSQLYQAAWLNSVRSTTLGHLILGSIFSWFDIAAYCVGVLAGALIDVSVFGVFSVTVGKRLTSRSTAKGWAGGANSFSVTSISSWPKRETPAASAYKRAKPSKDGIIDPNLS